MRKTLLLLLPLVICQNENPDVSYGTPKYPTDFLCGDLLTYIREELVRTSFNLNIIIFCPPGL